jgi:hypothetical protein
MAIFCSYDYLKHKHRIYAYKTQNGYVAEITRVDAKKGGIVQNITPKSVSSAVFATEKEAKNNALEFLCKLPVGAVVQWHITMVVWLVGD